MRRQGEGGGEYYDDDIVGNDCVHMFASFV